MRALQHKELLKGANAHRSLRSLGQQALELGVTIPVFAVNFDVVLELRQALTAAPTGVRVHMMVSKTVSELTVSNIIATTRQGDPDNKVVVGSHMDGVRAGPGINDNGSGTATNLEMALSLARLLARGLRQHLGLELRSGRCHVPVACLPQRTDPT